jgi:hypothetical protein
MDLDQDEALEAAQKRVKEGKEYVVDIESDSLTEFTAID